jgi:hypothetical protein
MVHETQTEDTMTNHVLDRSRAADTTRAQTYLAPERREGLHPATRALVRRKRTEGAARTQAFVKIARGGEGKV